jgi:hypothetical protein
MAKATTQTKATKTETKAEPKVETKAEPKVETKAEPKVETKKGGKKVTPQAEPVPTPEPAPVAETKKGGKKSSTKVEEPVTVQAVEAPKETKKGGKRVAKTEEPAVEAPKETKKGGKRAAKTEEPAPVQEAEPEAEPEADQEADQEANQEAKPGHRFFRCVFKNTDGEIVHAGRYSGKKPKQAARKALTAIVKKNELEVGERVMFLIQECTRGSKKKKYSYVGAQVNLPEPITVTIRKKDGQKSEIVYHKDNEVKKVSLSECGDLLDVEMEEDAEHLVAPVRLQRKPAKKAVKKPAKKVAKEVKEDTVPAKEAKKSKSK